MVRHEEAQPTVIVIDDDRDVRDALQGLLRSVGLRVELYGSAQEFMDGANLSQPGCLVLDVRLPGRSGLDFHDDLIKRNMHLPVVFISGHADVPMSVRAMKSGAVEFLTKPVRHQDLLDAVAAAIERDRRRREQEKELSDLRTLFESLSLREREVMAHVTAGLMNKQIAAEVGRSEITVKIHRGNVMKKMGARTLADLVRMAESLQIHRTKH